MRVCHVTTAHARHDTRVFLKECAALAAAGHDVHLVVGDGRGAETINQVSIHDVGPKPPSRLRRMWVQVRAARGIVESLAPDVVHFHDPELIPLGLRFARRGVNVIYDVHEDVPSQIRMKLWIPSGLRPMIARLFDVYEQRSVEHLAGVVAATPHIALRFSRLGRRLVCVNNYPRLDEVPSSANPSLSNWSDHQPRVCYVGGIARARGIRAVVEALSLVPNVRLVLCGQFESPGLEAELRECPGWTQVDYLGEVDRETVASVLQHCAAGIVTYLPAPNHTEAQPTKLFEYMAASLPVIASDFPLWRRIVAESGAGLCVNPESHEAIADAIRTIVNESETSSRMGRVGRAEVLSRYNWTMEAERLVAFYGTLGADPLTPVRVDSPN